MSGIQVPDGRQGKVVVTDVEYEGCSPEDTNVQEGMVFVPQMSHNWPPNEHPNGVGIQKLLDGDTAGLTRVKTENGEINLAIGGKVYVTAEPLGE